jgi:hypothetical protein
MLIHATDEMRVMRGDYRQYVGKADMKRPVAHLFVEKGEAMCSRKPDDDMRELESIPVDEVCRQCLVVACRKGLVQPHVPSPPPGRTHICGDPNDPCDYDCMARAHQAIQEAEENKLAASGLYKTGTGSVIDLEAIEAIGVIHHYMKAHINDDHYAFDVLLRSGQRLAVEMQDKRTIHVEKERNRLIEAWSASRSKTGAE